MYYTALITVVIVATETRSQGVCTITTLKSRTSTMTNKQYIYINITYKKKKKTIAITHIWRSEILWTLAAPWKLEDRVTMDRTMALILRNKRLACNCCPTNRTRPMQTRLAMEPLKGKSSVKVICILIND